MSAPKNPSLGRMISGISLTNRSIMTNPTAGSANIVPGGGTNRSESGPRGSRKPKAR